METVPYPFADGTVCQLRLLAAGDEPLLQAFFYSHQPESIHLRYGYMITQMTGERAHELVAVDQSRDCALALVEQSPEGPVIHAVARYCLDADGKGAEVAFIVREAKQRNGMATLLVKELVKTARVRGLERVWSQVLRENTGALRLLKKLGFKQTGVDEGNLVMTLALQPAPGGKKKGKGA
ncbi:MAG: GNAT family N-acetyltransferase [Candidatus Methylacidiphilales bacterium]|nr:GNAT family N-acetyltransferase [Candidatus Methylacidiphilales bacterium]